MTLTIAYKSEQLLPAAVEDTLGRVPTRYTVDAATDTERISP